MVSGGISPYIFLWSNGDVADSALGLRAGMHSVSVTDNNGCSVTQTFSLTEPSPVSVVPSFSNFNGSNVGCFGDSTACIFLSSIGGNAPYLYVWDARDTIMDSVLCSLPADTYSVRIIDANGCQLDTFFILTSPQQLTDTSIVSDFNGVQIQCNGLANGSVDVSVFGGVAPFSYNWSNLATSEDLSNLSAGNYQLIITDANSCKDTSIFIINEPSALTTAVVTVTDVSCNGQNDGIASVNLASGGTSPYSYSWSNGSSGLSAVLLPVGPISVIVSDINNCTVTANATLKLSECDFELPTSFSPNGDGFNDFYVIHGISLYPKNIFKVFNRWGNEVYSTEDYTNIEWQGQNSDGEELPVGTYFVTFIVKNQDVKRNTFVDLRR